MYRLLIFFIKKTLFTYCERVVPPRGPVRQHERPLRPAEGVRHGLEVLAGRGGAAVDCGAGELWEKGFKLFFLKWEI